MAGNRTVVGAWQN